MYKKMSDSTQFEIQIEAYMSFKMFHMCPCNKNKKNSMIGCTKAIKMVQTIENVFHQDKMTTATHIQTLQCK